jgi:hypothetical protein
MEGCRGNMSIYLCLLIVVFPMNDGFINHFIFYHHGVCKTSQDYFCKSNCNSYYEKVVIIIIIIINDVIYYMIS